uniref:Uncharacterized protein n=1 Tax=Moniliophthora roreri TaxID=221103 RepID=A0A0W0EYG0_MONRR
MALHGCSEFTISGGQFTNVQGNLVQYMQQAEKELTRWDDYRHIRTGDVYVTSVIGESEVTEYNETRQGKTFKHDFDKFSHIKGPYVAQLFGYNNNQNGLPALIFYNALIPLSHVILKNNRLSPVLNVYFCHQLGLWQPGAKITIGNLWIDPKMGTLCQGPQIQISRNWTLHSSASNLMLNNKFPVLPIQTYRDTSTTFNYLTRTVSTLNIITGIAWCYRTYGKKVANRKAISILTTLPGTIYHQHSQKIIAKLPARVRGRLHYHLYRADVGSNAMRESLVVMKDGSVRFTVTPIDIQHAKDMLLQYSISRFTTLTKSWISQAHSVLSQLQIHQDKWQKYHTHHGFHINFKCKRQHSRPQEKIHTTSNNTSVYLFIQPIPQHSDNEGIWRSWVEGTKYFWSSDPSGKEEVSEAMQVSLGLPSFTSTIEVLHSYWDQSVYEAIKMLHDYHHFDSTTTVLADSVGLTILEVVGNDSQFEVLDAPGTLPKTKSTKLKHIWKKMGQKMQLNWRHRRKETKG